MVTIVYTAANYSGGARQQRVSFVFIELLYLISLDIMPYGPAMGYIYASKCEYTVQQQGGPGDLRECATSGNY